LGADVLLRLEIPFLSQSMRSWGAGRAAGFSYSCSDFKVLNPNKSKILNSIVPSENYKVQTRLRITIMLSSTLRYIHPSLAMPDDIQAEAFPDATLSVLDFLQFPLPIVSGAASQHKASDFFSSPQQTI